MREVKLTQLITSTHGRTASIVCPQGSCLSIRTAAIPRVFTAFVVGIQVCITYATFRTTEIVAEIQHRDVRAALNVGEEEGVISESNTRMHVEGEM
jgi:hypothetical protein